jgi:hypothetical protein
MSMRKSFFSFPAVLALVAAFLVPDLGLAKPKKGEDKEAAAEEVKLDEEEGEGKKEEGSSEGEESASDSEEKKEGEESKEEDASGGESTPDRPEREASSPVEKKGQSYYFVGLRARAIVVPTFIIEAFGDGGQTVMGPMIGPEFGIRRDGFEYDFAITYTSYPMERTPFKAPTDPDVAMELVESQIKVLYFTADFMWGHQFSPIVSLMYGGSAGLGFVWGPLYRSQAYRTPSGGWAMCNGPNNPGGGYCEPDPQHGDKQHFGNYQEPSWFGGGDKPAIMPWLALQMGLRIKPHRRFVGRLDFGIGIGQVFFGLGLDYGL